MISLNAFLLLGHLSSTSLPASFRIDVADVLARNDAIMRTSSTLTGSYTMTYEKGAQSSSTTVNFRLAKPDKVAVLNQSADEFFDGKTHFQVNKVAQTFVAKDVRITGAPFVFGVQNFLTEGSYKYSTPGKTSGAVETSFGGRMVVKRTYDDGTPNEYSVMIDPTTALPVGYEYSVGTAKYTALFSKLSLNEVMQSDAFSYVPSRNMKELVCESPDLLKVGSLLPKLDTPEAKTLDRILEKKGATVLAFVKPNELASSDMVQTMNEMSKTAPVTLSMVAVSQKLDIRRYVKNVRINTIIDNGALTKLAGAYGVTQYPTIFVADPSGKIIFRQVGLASTTKFSEALSKLGFNF
jgi:outer membrane lipoprotein-sorting protein